MPQMRRPDPTAMATGGTHIPWPPWATTLADDIRQLLPPEQRGPGGTSPTVDSRRRSPATTFTADQARDCIDRAEVVISEFLSVDPEQRRDFAVHLLLYRLSEGMADTGEVAFR